MSPNRKSLADLDALTPSRIWDVRVLVVLFTGKISRMKELILKK
jgi:hypothetical protein